MKKRANETYADLGHIDQFEQELLFRLVVSLDPERQVRAHYNITPVPFYQAAAPGHLLLARHPRGQGPVGDDIRAEPLLESDPVLPPVSVVDPVHDGRLFFDAHLVVPVYQVHPEVIPLLVVVPQSVVPVLLYVEADFAAPGLEDLHQLIDFLVLYFAEVKQAFQLRGVLLNVAHQPNHLLL